MTELRRLGPVPALDGLRGVAIVLVLVFHTTALTFTADFTNIGAIDKAIGGGVPRCRPLLRPEWVPHHRVVVAGAG